MTCIPRFLFVLLCLALTYTAAASTSKEAASVVGCHDAAQAAASVRSIEKRAAISLHDLRAMHAHNHELHAIATDHTHANCDCAQKCGCSQHCMTSGVMTQSPWCALTPSLSAFVVTDIAIDVPAASISSPFRPPIITFS